MRCEIPLLQRCCCCFPLRYGLMAWGYFKLLISILLLLDVSYVLTEILMSVRNSHDFQSQLAVIILLFVIIIITVTDIVLDVTFIKACRQKNAERMKRFYYFNIFLLVLIMISNLFVFPIAGLAPMGAEWFDTYSILSIALQAYMLVLVRSELIKLNNGKPTEDVEAGGVTDTAKEDEPNIAI